MKLLPLLVLVVAACETPSPLEQKGAPGAAGAPGTADNGAASIPEITAINDRLDKLETQLTHITSVLEKHPNAASSPGEYNAARVDRIESQLDKVVAILRDAIPPAEPDPNGVYAVPISASDPVEGPPDAKVTIVEGYEFLCPFCAQVNPTVEQIRAKYPDDVRLVSKYLIIHGPPAVLPGMAACAANKQGKFKEMKAAVWAALWKVENGKPQRVADHLAAEDLDKLAAATGVDADKLKTDMTGPDCRAWIEQSTEIMKPLGATATPAFFINGRFVGGAESFDKFDALIQEELAKADAKIKGGVAKADYYNKEILAKGQKKVKGPLDD
nr:thioredoxin domain-containing protein [Kofleriaceae bacterium]